MLQYELEDILKKHALYEKGDPRGKRADLSGAKLSDADLFKAILCNANLSSADMSDAILSWADLRGANLSGAKLRGAKLRGAILINTNLSGANLSLASMFSAHLNNADLKDANLSDANLINTNLSGANLRGAKLRGANLRGANLSGADLSGAKFDPDLAIPVIESIDERILDAIQQEGARLKMDAWHTCETTHCRAGWAIVLAGEAGKALEKKVGPCAAGALIYAVSRPNKRVPDFYASDEGAMDSIVADAQEAQKETV